MTPTYEGLVEAQGWDEATMLDLALAYIDNQGSHDAWIDFLQQRADIKNAGAQALGADGPDEPRLAEGADRPADPVDRVEAVKARLIPEVAVLLDGLAARGIQAFAVDNAPTRELVWLVVERDGNAGTVSYDPLLGYSVVFAIRPGREIGSGLLVSDPKRCPDREGILDLAEVAVGARFGNFATGAAQLPNDGLKHFDWCRDAMVPVNRVEGREVAP